MKIHPSSFKKKYKYILFFCLIAFSKSFKTFAQTEVEPWGNLKGIRIDGQLMNIESSINLINASGPNIFATGKEKQRPKFFRDDNKQIIKTNIDSFYFVETFEDLSKGVSKVDIQFTSKKDTTAATIIFDLKLPVDVYNKSILRLTGAAANSSSAYTMAEEKSSFTVTCSGFKFNAAQQQAEVNFDEQQNLLIKTDDDNKGFIHIYIPIQKGAIANGATIQKIFTIKSSGAIDKSPVTVEINTAVKGRLFAGFGGNFRLQNPKADPQVIDYCLNNMRVAYSRVEMPWMLWQPVENCNPVDSAKAGKLNRHVKESMEMAQRLSKMNIPVILTAWFPPQWAVVGALHFRHKDGEEWGNPLDSTKAQQIYKSITDYILYLKDAYGVDIKLFSFNESDLGINVRQTGEEHDALIKGLGSYFAKHGLQTKMLLGDNSDATTFNFINTAMNDVDARKYIGAISFHSWRGWDTETLQKWANAATKLKLPLLIGEGSIDAAAYAYPKIFEEQIYALEEINLYVRLLNQCQPLSILQWQLTSDYSPLKGGGIFGDSSALQPIQRFWNLKQLASIPVNVYAVSAKVDKPEITCAAEVGSDKNIVVIHLVNNGAKRMVILKGLPSSIKKLSVHTTSKNKNMQEEKPVAVGNGHAKFILDDVSYTTIVSE